MHTFAYTSQHTLTALELFLSSLMDFSKLTPNPNKKPLLENPYLLEDMERHRFVHSRTSPFKIYPPKHTPPRLRKTRKGYKNCSIPFYQSSKYQTPNTQNPRPRKPFWPKVYSRKHAQQPYQNIPRPVFRPPPTPQLVNPSDSKKYLNMIKNVQPGINIHVHGGVLDIIKAARWEGIVSHLGKVFHVHLMGEFYCNMRIIKGLDGVLHFTTVVETKTILIDHKTINKALHLPAHLSEKPCLDIFAFFMFNKAEFQLMLGTFCDLDVPLGLCDVNYGIHYKHFSSKFQYLALILRANVMPKPNQSKFFDFFDMKLLFLLYTNKINFKISYVILLNMLNANFVDYMPYGLLLTSLFDIYHIPMPSIFASQADSQITPEHVRPQVSLIHCEPHKYSPTVFPPVLSQEDIYLANCESVKMLIEEQKIELRRLKTENDEIKGRLRYLEGLAASTM